ncbi:MAG TPA: PKD domain-containing protein [Candidatus Binatia bacterium]|nr:PKD domain-containing protein [Candidatus Binatia bacterium]
MRRALALLLLGVLLAPHPALAKKRKGNQLLRVISPTSVTPAAAHPFINVLVGFGYDEGTPDPSTFKARLGGVNVTPLFEPVIVNGKLEGMRASISPALLVIGNHRGNRFRFEVRGRSGKRRLRDIDRLRFAALDTANAPPVARALPATVVVLPNVPLEFNARESVDPEGDPLTYHWDFGDGTVSTDARTSHAFRAGANPAVVRLTVSDGQAEASDDLRTLSVPVICPTCTPGVIKVAASAPLEYGGIPVGTTVTRTFTVTNASTEITSELAVNMGTSSGAFVLGTNQLDLHAGESAEVQIAFTPPAGGHQSSEVIMVASASNQTIVQLLAHGYGGAAAGTGPIPTADPVFFSGVSGTQALLPSGQRLGADDSVHTCVNPTGAGSGDYCITDADCSVNGGTCPSVGTCIRGDRNGQPCSSAIECPGGFGCTAALPFLPIDVCGDGEGGLILLSDDGTFTDQTNAEAELSGTLMHVTLDANGNRTGAQILARTTSGTTQATCDRTPASQGGQVYLAEYRAVIGPSECFRDAREALVARKKSNGTENVLMPRIDAAEDLPECEDYDPVTDLKIVPDGSAVFASLPNTGLYRIRPTSLFLVTGFDDFFQVHPDGSVIIVRASDTGPTGVLKVYKIAPDQAVNGALTLDDLTPCGSIEVPNNGGRTLIDTTYAVDRTAPNSPDGTVLVSFAAFAGQSVLSRELLLRGTVAFSAPAFSDTCTPLGFINLELLDDVSF